MGIYFRPVGIVDFSPTKNQSAKIIIFDWLKM